MEKAALLAAIIENAIDGFITIDYQGKIESVNPAACKLFRYRPDEVIGKNVRFLMPPPHQSAHDDYLHRYQQTSEAHIIGIGREVLGMRKDQSIFPFRLSVSKVHYSERIIYAGFIHDLSREKEAEEHLKEYTAHLEELVDERTISLKKTVSALQKAKEEISLSLQKEIELSQLKSRFVSMASHEFRTPLSSIQLSASLVERYTEALKNPKIGKHIGKIKTAIGHLSNILNDLLSLEKLQTGKIEPHFQEFDLVKFSEEITEEMQMVAKEHQQIIYQHTGNSSLVKLDQNLLRHCLINLLSNATKYSADHAVIEFDTELKGHSCLLKIKDSGIGIPDADLKHLFEPFFRASNVGTISGTGLGLNIVSRYIDLMNGTISVISSEKSGSTFTITFPYHDAKSINY